MNAKQIRSQITADTLQLSILVLVRKLRDIDIEEGYYGPFDAPEDREGWAADNPPGEGCYYRTEFLGA